MSETVEMAVFMRVSTSQDGAPIPAGIFLRGAIPPQWDMRMRYNPDIRGMPIAFPKGTRTEQVMDALDRLHRWERVKLYRIMEKWQLGTVRSPTRNGRL